METCTKKFTVKHLETWLPERCRKPRYRVVQESMDFGIRSYTKEEAPVAFRISGTRDADGDVRWDGERYYRPLKGYDDWGAWLLRWSRRLSENYTRYEGDDKIADLSDDYGSRASLVSEVESLLDEVCLIDGALWKSCGEPGWTAHIWWGTGHRRYAALYVKEARAAKWNALQREQAEAEAVSNSFGPIELRDENGESIEVLMPEAVKSDPRGVALAEARAERETLLEEARAEYRQAREALEAARAKESAYREANEGAPWLHTPPASKDEEPQRKRGTDEQDAVNHDGERAKTCPVCGARAFADAAVCHGCLHRFDGKGAAE